MGKGNGVLRKISGSVGDLNYRVVGGMQVVAAKATHVKNPKTARQMEQRTRWSNVLMMYRAANGTLKNAFETKAQNVSDFNMFMSSNLHARPVYMTREMKALNAGIAAPYLLSQGTLDMIEVTGKGKDAVTDIILGSLTIGAATTVADFSKAVERNNTEWKYGDQMSFFYFMQKMNKTEGFPYLKCAKYEVTLDAADDSLLLSHVPAFAFANVDGFLGCNGTAIEPGCMAWVHSREVDGKIQVSTQRLVLDNPIYEQYTTEPNRNNAMLSYGMKEDSFLTPSGIYGQQTGPSDSDGESDGNGSPSGSNPSGGQQTTDNGQQSGNNGQNPSGGESGGDDGLV
ncbi:MAG: hypothetical protein KBT15_11400 [Bacteroidales bacterium]|nr:hypothetical protein [Candidatus Minthousia equi]